MKTNDLDAERAVLRAGFIGSGFMTGIHARAVRAVGAIPAGVASSTPESAEAASVRLGLGPAFSSVEQLLADDSIDVVHICTPNTTHAELTEAAIRAGKHVICEKPLATSAADGARLTRLAADADAVGVVPFVYRFHPMVREARSRVRNGQAGRILSVQGSYLQDWLLSSEDNDWRVDEKLGGPSRAFADIGSHLCDLIEFVLDDRIQHLTALTRTVFRQRGSTTEVKTEDIVSVLFETRKGTVGTLMISQVAPGRKNRLALEIGAMAESLFFDQENPELLWVGRRGGAQLLQRDAAVLDPAAAKYSVVPPGHPQGYQDAFNALMGDAYAAMDGRVPDGLPVFADGYRSAVLTEAILESNARRTWVEVPAPPPDPLVHKPLNASIHEA
ncbi:Gfo/Idh/MocA family protein [Arthrobacter sp. RHLT1-20]